MKRILTALCLVALVATAAYGQGGQNELVSQRMADAINSGKFYFKIHGISTDTDEHGQAIRIAATSSLAVKDKVSMSRMDDFKMVSISANGYSYTLDEQQKSYFATKDDDEANMDIGTLTFSRQGTCQLNGAEYYYDEWRSTSGVTVTFYYNTTRVAAIDFGLPGISSGAMSILSFDTRIPDNMYFCLGKEWKQNDMMSGIGANVDVNQYLTPELLKSIEGSLPEGMDINAIMAQAGVGQGQGAAGAIPPPPSCTSPWTDNSASVELGAGINLGDINITGKKPASPMRYLAQFTTVDVPKLNLSMDVTDDGVWKALDTIEEETKGMADAEAMEHLLKYCDEMVAAAEIGCVTGEMIERAVATCMLCPSSAVYNNTAMLFFYKGDTPNALLYYQQAEKMDADNAIILTNIAECFFELGDLAAARRYADRAVSLEPEYGLAFQLLTSLNLKEKLYVLAAETLFKSARNYFSDITACQFFSLKMALISASALAEGGYPMKALLDQVFSPAHLDLLTEATRAGFTTNGQDTPANQKRFNWPVKNGSIHSIYKSLQSKRYELDALLLAHNDRLDQLLTADNLLIGVYLAMGTQNMAGDIANMQDMIDMVSPVPVNIPTMPSINAYAVASTAYRQGADGSFLLDARQYWCLDMWMTYYHLLYQYSNGFWAGGDDQGNPTGDYPAAYAQMLREKEAIRKAHEKDHEKFIASTLPCGMAYSKCMESAQTERQQRECRIAYLRCLLPLNKKYIQNDFAAMLIEEMGAEQKFYVSTVQPVLEEWWLKMNAMTGYCDNLNMQEYFLTSAMKDINEHWQHHPLSDGWTKGEMIDTMWKDMVLALEDEIGIEQSIIDQLPADPPRTADKSDIRLKNYGEKDKFDFNVGVNTPFGRVSFAREDNHYKYGTENTVTGTTKIHNLTNGEETSYTTYASLAHTPEPSKGYLMTLAEWKANKTKGEIKSNVINAVGKGLGIGKVASFIPNTSTQTGIQRMRTLDSEGNVTDSGIVKFRERSFGVGDVGASFRQTQIRTGNTIRTTNHARLSFKFVDVQVGR